MQTVDQMIETFHLIRKRFEEEKEEVREDIKHHIGQHCVAQQEHSIVLNTSKSMWVMSYNHNVVQVHGYMYTEGVGIELIVGENGEGWDLDEFSTETLLLIIKQFENVTINE